MRTPLLAVTALAATIALPATSSAFDNTSSWTKGRIGGRTCLIDHKHAGHSPSWPTLAGAKAAAIRKWESFTIWEYGKAWGSYRLAANKSMSCQKDGSRHICMTTANPCRR